MSNQQQDTNKALAGTVALVTGASRGIGADVARRLGALGARVACVARTLNEGGSRIEGSLEKTVQGIREAGGDAVALTANLAVDDEVESLVDRVRQAMSDDVGILINNAAAGFFGPTAEMPTKRWRLSWTVNVDAPFTLVKSALPSMLARGSGRIVNISSGSAIGPGRGPYRSEEAPIGDTVYGAQKAALERFTQGLACELAGSGVGVAALAPSQVVPTPGALMNGMISGPDDPEAEPRDCIPEAVRLLVTQPVDEMSGQVVYSQQLLREHGLLDAGNGLGVDPSMPVSGYSTLWASDWPGRSHP
jgi:citronellol/citronellal dehydrogenase